MSRPVTQPRAESPHREGALGLGSAAAFVVFVALVATTSPGRAIAADAGLSGRAADAGTSPDTGTGARGSPPEARLRVLATGAAPFVAGDGTALTGLSVELWRDVASDLGVEYELLREPGVARAVERIGAGEADVAVGPVSITAERARTVTFTQPYYASGLAIAAPAETSLWARLLPLASRAFLAGIGVLLLVLAGVGTSVWLVERKKNPKMFPAGPVRGIGNGIWFALVTMTTVGYGDRVPVSLAGRVVAGVWMVIAMLSVSSLTAGIATTLTVLKLDRASVSDVRDLSGRRVAVVRGTPAVGFVGGAGAVPVPVDDIAAAVDRVRAGAAAAIVHDRPILRYHLGRLEAHGLAMSEATYEPQGYGFVVRGRPELRARLDAAILEYRQGGRMRTLERRFLDGADVD